MVCFEAIFFIDFLKKMESKSELILEQLKS